MNVFAKFGLVAAALSSTASAAPQPQLQTAVLAGGCFWGMELVFEHVKGVKDVVSGFAGGSASDANYAAVSSEETSHAEAVKITYDPSQISYFDLLKIYFTVAHDPTEVNRQGPDIGPSYRSAIFPQDAQQKAIATKTIAQLKAMGKPIATRVESGGFYPAEAYHQDFADKHPDYLYIVINDRPKLAALKKSYPQWWKA
jgi:peptide-methionine (S)-S-oxide reductase